MGRRVLSRPGSTLGFRSQRNSFLPWDQGGFISSDFNARAGLALGAIENLDLGGNIDGVE